jgi:hypothetical protein
LFKPVILTSGPLRLYSAHPRYPAVVVHGLADIRAVLSLGMPVTFLSAEGAALYAGSGWWHTLMCRATAAYPDVPCDNILDCADAPGAALAALRIGQRRIILHRSAPGWARIAAAARSLDCVVLSERPAALDLAQPGTARRLHEWLRSPTAPGDRNGALG